MIEFIEKRNKNVVSFDSSKIKTAIFKAGQATEEFGEKEAKNLTMKAVSVLKNILEKKK